MDEQIALNPYYIKCYPGLDIHFKSKYISKIMGKLEFWFDRTESKSSFYKFSAPCKHSSYKPGNSWAEEIGISRKVFNAAFKLIGMSYNSKSSFSAQVDPFQGKFYVKFYDRQKNVTYFFKNHAVVKEFLDQFIHSSKSENENIPQENSEPVTPEHTTSPKCRSGNGPKCRSSISYNNKHIKISSKDNNLFDQHAKFDVEEKMRNIWIDEIGDCSVSKITPKLATELQLCWAYFNQSFEEWRSYCQKIASSKFLMGEKEGTSFKAWFTWAIKIPTIVQIQSGVYSLYDREIKKLDQTITLMQQANILVKQQSTTENQLFHQYLLKQGGVQDYHRWLKHLTISINDVGGIIIKTISNFIRDSVENRFRCLLKEAIRHTFKVDKYYKITTLVMD